MHPVFRAPDNGAIPIYLIDAKSFGDGRGLDQGALAFARAAGFEPKPGRYLLLPGKGDNSKLAGVLFGIDAPDASARDPFGTPHRTGSPVSKSCRWRALHGRASM